jgi:hypothetical protein
VGDRVHGLRAEDRSTMCHRRRTAAPQRACVCMCACVCVRAYVLVSAWVCERGCVQLRVHHDEGDAEAANNSLLEARPVQMAAADGMGTRKRDDLLHSRT